jgi:hypothetical protein
MSADTSVLALKNIEFQMNKHLKNKFGQKYKKVSIDTNERNMYNAEVFNDLVEYEIKHLTSSKKWASLPLFFKWNCIQTYLNKNNIIDKDVINNIKKKLNAKIENVTYDPISQEITDIMLD